MPRTTFSLKSAHLLMWSSPILLLILVFTLTSASGPRRPAASLSPTSTSLPVTVTTHVTRPLHRTPVQHPTAIAATRSAVVSSSNVTDSTARPAKPVATASALNGAQAGTLSPQVAFVDVPLGGPGRWTLTTSAPTSQTLICAGQSSPVNDQVVVGATQNCQLEITSTSAEASLTWQLTPST